VSDTTGVAKKTKSRLKNNKLKQEALLRRKQRFVTEWKDGFFKPILPPDECIKLTAK
jgi:hypothetical protein